MALNKTIIKGAAFDLPDKKSSKERICVPYGSSLFRVSSFGYFAGEDPIFFPFPVLMLQLFSILFVTRLLYFLLRPLKQPRVVCDVIGGLLLSPSVLGLIKVTYTDRAGTARPMILSDLLVPGSNIATLRTISAFAVMFYFFLVGVKIDPMLLTRSGKKPWVIGFVSFVLPFFFGLACLGLRQDHDPRGIDSRFVIFVVAATSLTSFPVLADILAEINLLNSELGRLAMSSAMVHGVIGFTFISAFTAMNQGQGGSDKAAWACTSLVTVIVIIAFLFRPWMQWIIRRTPKGGRVDDRHIFAIFSCVIAMGMVSDFIGTSFVYAPLVMGMAVPDGPPLGAALVEKAHLLIVEGMMPLFFWMSGLNSDLTVLRHITTRWAKMSSLLLASYVVKTIGTTASAIYYRIPVMNALLLGLMMNVRGVVEIMTLFSFKFGGLIDKDRYTVLLLVTMLGTAIAVPLVSTLYNPAVTGYGHRTIQQLKAHAELRILACVQSPNPITAIINLIEASSTTNATPPCVYVLHLMELVGRATSNIIAHKNKKGLIDQSTPMDHIHDVFLNHELNRVGGISVQPFTSIAPVRTMHQDICSLAGEKGVAIIVVPFQRKDGSVMTDADQAIRSNIPSIQAQAPCSVGILVYPDLVQAMIPESGRFQHRIGVLFWGGPDDREALAYASRMVRRVGVRLTVFHYMLTADRRDAKEQKLDDNMLAAVLHENAANKDFSIERVVVKDVEQTIRSIKSTGNCYHLLLVGQKQGANSLLDAEFSEWTEFPELGVVGDILASKDFEGTTSSVLVIQH